ncbi:MAG: trigger factor, partial [Alphaproteobacteria bacterium]
MTEKNKLAHSFTITIPAKDFANRIDTKLKEIAKEAKIQGFRPGQAPMTLIKSKYENAVKGEVLDGIIQEHVEKTFKDKSIRPAVRPKVELKKFEDGQDIELQVDVESLPDIKPVDFKTLTIERMTAPVTQAEMEKALDRLLMGKRTTEIVNEKRATKTGDIIVIDFTGSINGEEFKGGKGKDYYLDLGSNTFIPGFEDQLTGKEIGSTVDVNVTFPENYHAKELAGKKALFKVDIKELRKVVKPELNDDFAKSLGIESLEKLKETVKTELDKEYKSIARMHAKRALLDVLAETHSFDVPQGMVDMEFDSIWKQL